jgi:hypothetical protein
VEAFFFFLLDVVCWSLRLYFAALADWTAARGEEVWNGRRKDGGAIALGAARKRLVGEALVRHEGQYRCAAIIAGCISIDRTTILYGLLVFVMPARTSKVGAEVSWDQLWARARTSLPRILSLCSRYR